MKANSKHLLSDKFAKTAAPNARHWDSKTSGFCLRTGKHVKTWVLEHRGNVHNLGRFPDVSAADARDAAFVIMAPSANIETSPTLDDALRDYLGRDKLRSSQNKRAVDGQMRIHMAKFLKRRLHTITKQEIRKRFTELSTQRNDGVDSLGRKTKVGGKRVANHVMMSFRTIWNHAASRMMEGDLKSCPTSALEFHDEEPPKTVIEDLSGWRDQIALIDPMHRMFYELLLLTGMRKSELLEATWSQVHEDRIHLPMTKNGRPFDVPLEKEHRDILNVLHSIRRAGVDFIFWSPKGDGHLTMPQKVGPAPGEFWTPQMHRRTFATEGAAAGLAPWQVSQLINHTIEGVTSKNYIATNIEHYRPFMRTYLDHIMPRAFKR